MFTSRENKRIAFGYCKAAAAWYLFAVIYEQFSHGVLSMWIITLALWPLLGGALPFGLAARKALAIPDWSKAMWHGGLATLTMMAALNGVMEIFGGSFEYTLEMSGIGGALCLCGITLLLGKHIKRDKPAAAPTM